MKKQIGYLILGGALILGSGVFVYNTYAADVEKSNQDQTQVQAQTPPEAVVESSTLTEGLIDINDVPAEDIHIPNLTQDNSSLRSAEGATTSLKPINTTVTKGELGLLIRQSYKASNGTEIIVSQTDSRLDEAATIESLKNSYKLENVQLTQINGHTAAFVDGQARKVVHLITGKHFYTVSSPNGTLEELLNIAKQIQE
ncbi:hypothetical protein D3C81_842150 [compost metagenome]